MNRFKMPVPRGCSWGQYSRFKIGLLVATILIGGAVPVVAGENCTTVIVDNYQTKCIDGYEWLVKYEKFGCQTSVVPVAQKFEIYPKKNGKPKMVIPVACEEIEPAHIPTQ